MNPVLQSGYGYEYDAWLASACMPASTVRKLLDCYETSEACHSAFLQNDPELQQLITRRFYQLLSASGTKENLDRYKKTMDQHGIRTICFHDIGFPPELDQTDDPPAILFFQGNTDCIAERSLCVVGSRAASYAGQKAARNLSADLGAYGVTIVSGMACGIDACAHSGCLDGGGKTIAVLGSGLDRPYPRDNLALRNRILEKGGLILSEYAPGESALGWHFPVRNRIITGLSRALILMEAKIRSGSMTSVNHALAQGKDVFVYPGDPASECFEGNHQLLREGGIYFTSARDILEDLHWLDNPSAVRQNSDCVQEYKPSTPEEDKLIRALKPGTMSFEQLIVCTGMNPSSLMSTLTVLQIRGIIEALPGKQYQLKH